MSLMKAPENTPVWTDESRCKACDICVAVCPAGVLAMRYEPHSVLGAMITVEAPELCIGCNDCELSCPDFAIFVADRKEYKFAKLTDQAKERAEAIKKNNYMTLSA
ncbi:4Fe-4S dicluster domain-containing protein [Hydrogenimonas sp.]|jgi:2-oxoglutarate ferredoxin oxidoreductase subunit delta